MSIIQTDRIELIPAPPEFIQLLIDDEYVRAGNLLNLVVPHGWPNDAAARAGLSHHLQALKADPEEFLWRIRLIVERQNRTLIGSINLKGPPNEKGDVEIGWGVVVEQRKRGIAVDATRAVIEWVFTDERVRRVIATIPEDNIASSRVATRLGMCRTKELKRDLPVWALSKE